MHICMATLSCSCPMLLPDVHTSLILSSFKKILSRLRCFWQQLAKHSIQAINYHDLPLDNSSADGCAFLTFYSRNAKRWDLYCDTAYHCADFKTPAYPFPTEQLLVSAVTQAKWLNILTVSFFSSLHWTNDMHSWLRLLRFFVYVAPISWHHLDGGSDTIFFKI